MFDFIQRWLLTNTLCPSYFVLDCLVHLIFQQDRKILQFWWYIVDPLVSNARFPEIFFSTNLRVNQWKNKIGAYDRWSVNHNSTWSSVVKPVTVPLSPERNRNMVKLSQLPKQKPVPPPSQSVLVSSCLCGKAGPPHNAGSFLSDSCDCPRNSQVPDTDV